MFQELVRLGKLARHKIMTPKDLKELRLLLLTVQLKKAADKRILMPLKMDGMKRKGVVIHD